MRVPMRVVESHALYLPPAEKFYGVIAGKKGGDHLKPVDVSKLHRMEKVNREVGALIGEAIEQSGGKYGFALFMFSFNDESEMTWISNAERADMIKALKEFIQKNETGEDDEFEKAKRWNARQN